MIVASTPPPPAPAALAVGSVLADALAEIRRRRGAKGTAGLTPGLLAPDRYGLPATGLTTGRSLDALLDAAKQRWRASPHAAAALAWRSYAYWLALPAVLSWATTGRVPLLDPAEVRVRVADPPGAGPLVTLGFTGVRVAVAPDDPLAGAAYPDVTVAPSAAALPDLLRASLLDHHLAPLRAQIQARVRLGTRTLYGSVASAVGYALVRGLAAPPATVVATAEELLARLGLAGLVEFPPGPDGRPALRRRTCCLAFTLPEPKICSGCCLRA